MDRAAEPIGETPLARSMGATTGSAITLAPSMKFPTPIVISRLRRNTLVMPCMNQLTIRTREPVAMSSWLRRIPAMMTSSSGNVVNTPSRPAISATETGV